MRDGIPATGVGIQGHAVSLVARQHEAVAHRGEAEHDAQRPDGAAELVVRLAFFVCLRVATIFSLA